MGVFDFLFIKVKPYPYLMSLSNYARAAIVYLFLSRRWRRAGGGRGVV